MADSRNDALQAEVVAEIEKHQHEQGYAMNAPTYRQKLYAIAEFAVERERAALRATPPTTKPSGEAVDRQYEMVGFETGDTGRVVAECPKCHHTAPMSMTREQFLRVMIPQPTSKEPE